MTRAVGGGVRVVFGGIEIGLAIRSLVKGTETMHDIQVVLNVLEAAAGSQQLHHEQPAVLRQTISDLTQLYSDAKSYNEGCNGAKIGGGAASAVGGGLLSELSSVHLF